MTERRGPRSASERLRRLLVMLPWLMEQGEVPVAEVAQRFAIDEGELVRDLELAALCGLPPFVDEMIDVFIDEGTVFTGVPRVFTRPLRLTAPEGFALLAAAKVAMEMPGADPDGALARALRKLAAVLGDDAVVVDSPAPPLAGDLAAAIAEGTRVVIGYWSARADARSERLVAPRRLFTDRGRWYLIADEFPAGEERTFRLDRIDSCTVTADTDPPRTVDVPSGDDWFRDDDLPVATLRLAPGASWVVERFPMLRVRTLDLGWEVDVVVTDERWLADLLLCLGPDAEVLAPEAWRDLGARRAAAVLARYEAAG